MNAWIIAAVVVGLLVFAGILFGAGIITAKETPKISCESCGNRCASEANCGQASCAAANGGKCSCGG